MLVIQVSNLRRDYFRSNIVFFLYHYEHPNLQIKIDTVKLLRKRKINQLARVLIKIL